MGYGCRKHEWDEGSEAWVDAAKAAAFELHPDTHDRTETPCPACVLEVLKELKTLRSQVACLKEALLAAEDGDDIAFWQGVDRLGEKKAAAIKQIMDAEKAEGCTYCSLLGCEDAGKCRCKHQEPKTGGG